MAFQYNNKLLRVKVDTKEILQEISFSFDADTEYVEKASKDSENTFEPVKQTFNLSGEAYVDNTAAAAEQDTFAMMAWHADKSQKAFAIGDAVSGNITITGNSFMKSYSFKGENNGIATYSWTMQVEGIPTVAQTA